jgi:hypothetical protein
MLYNPAVVTQPNRTNTYIHSQHLSTVYFVVMLITLFTVLRALSVRDSADGLVQLDSDSQIK